MRRCLRASLAERGTRSPFDKVIDLDYYDGPISGLLWSEECSADALFDLLDTDRMGNLRIYSLALLPPGSFIAAAAVCSRTEGGAPREPWSEWFPVWRFSSESAKAAAERAMDQIVARAAPPFMIVAALAWKLTDTILVAREVSGELANAIKLAQDLIRGPRPSVQATGAEPDALPDWFAVLGLDRTAYLDIDDEGDDATRPLA